MNRLAHTVTAHPIRVLLVWLAAIAAVAVLTSPGGVVQQADVMKSNQADFLPNRYESVRATKLLNQAFPTPDGATATIVIRRPDGGPLTRATSAERARWSPASVTATACAPPSPARTASRPTTRSCSGRCCCAARCSIRS
jgi:RND superfamily putative drug exporter